MTIRLGHQQHGGVSSLIAKQAQQHRAEIQELREYLQARVNPAAAANLEASMRLAWPAPEHLPDRSAAPDSAPATHLNFELRQGQLHWLEPNVPVQATFWFRDAQDLAHLLSDSDSAYQDFMQRFMAAELSSDGYLPWAFTLLSLFRGGPGLNTPS